MVAAVDGRASYIDEAGFNVSTKVQAIEAFFRRHLVGMPSISLHQDSVWRANGNCFIRDWTP